MLRLAYFTNQYPKVSHTFIRREIVELERRGHEVLRLAIRPTAEGVVDEADRAEAEKTHAILGEPKPAILANLLKAMLTSPGRFLKAFNLARRMAKPSERGLLIHLIYLAEAATLERLLKKHNVQHMHVHFGTNPSAVATLARELGGPTFSITMHGPDEFDAPVGLSLATKTAASSFVATVSSFGSSQLKRWCHLADWPKVKIVHCTIDKSFTDAATPVDGACRTLLSIGRLNAQKGQFVLLDALAKLRAAGTDVKLVLLGDGELREPVEARIDELGIRDAVRITGWMDEAGVRQELQACRGLVMPSFAEGLPVVMMEAYALERPIVSTYVAGIPELIEPGVNGWLVPAGDVDALADAMQQMLDTPAERLHAMAKHGRAAVEQRHTVEGQVDRLEALFKEVA